MSPRTPRVALAVVALTLFLGLAACDRAPESSTDPTSSPQPAAAESVLRRGNFGDPGSLDPQLAIDTGAFDILRDLYEGLLSESPDGTLSPGVATSWTVSPDGRVYRFTLRPEARWSDGSPVRAEHFVTAMRHAVDPASASPAADLLRAITGARQILAGDRHPETLGVRAVDPLTLEIGLDEPTAYFLSMLTHAVFYPRHPAAGTDGIPTHTISNGPYRFRQWVPNLHIEVDRNPHYWDRDNVRIGRVLYYPVASEGNEYLRYRAGDLDITNSVPISNLPDIRRERPSELRTGPYLGTYFLALNLQRPPFAGNPDLRRALSLAIDREALARQVLRDSQTPAWSLVPPGTADYEPQRDPAYALRQSERLAQARELYARATAGLSKPLKLRVIYGNSDAVRSVLIAIASMWREAFGLELDVYTEEFRAYLETQKDPDHWQVLRFAWVADYNDAFTFLELFRSDSPTNVFGYRDPQFDALLSASQRAQDPLQRAASLQDAESLLLADTAFIPLFHMKSRRLISPRVTGFVPTPLNRIYSKHLAVSD